jgi:hypothetical protein
MTVDRNEMGRRHDVYLAEIVGGRKTAGSGSQFHDQGDARVSRATRRFGFCAEGKSTRGKGLTIQVDTYFKLLEQAGGDRPVLGLRWYLNDRLDEHADLIAMLPSDFAEIREAAEEAADLAARVKALEKELAARVEEAPAAPAALWGPEGPPPRLPWYVVAVRSGEIGVLEHAGWRWDERGHKTTFAVSTVRVENNINAATARLIVNEILVQGELWVDGVLQARSGMER